MDKPDQERDKKIMHHYFNAWKRLMHSKKQPKEKSQKIDKETKEKIDNLVEAIKKCRAKNEAKKAKNIKIIKPNKAQNDNYKNRFNAQKVAIEKLTVKLEEKDRIIDELQLGIIDKETLKSLNKAKVDIREIFATCSAKTRAKVAPPPEFNEKFMIATKKIPKILQELDGKAAERAKRREIVSEKRRQFEEDRQKSLQESIEKKRVQDEEERKRNLEKIREERRREMEKKKIRDANKLKYLEKMKTALALYNGKMLKNGFEAISENYKKSKVNWEKAVVHFKISILSKAITEWKNFVEDKYKDKKVLADAVFAKNALIRALKRWRELRIESVRKMQVAEDFYDLLLMNNSFVHWHRYVCIQLMLLDKKMRMAEKHDNQRVLFHYFYLWRTLPAVIQLEKSKEMKMQKWRARVWEILPDYKPPTQE